MKWLWKKILSLFKKHKTHDGEGSSQENKFDYKNDLVWEYGGLKATNAKEVAQIKNLRVDISKKKMYYSWVSGGCESMGAANKDEYKNTYACIFYWDGVKKKWIGGKFDEISTSRTWRPLNNCANYRGWKWEPFASAGKYAFLIVSKTGSKRTNVIFS